MNEREKEKILDQVKDRLVAEGMDTKNTEGRVISVVNDEISKRSGGIMMSPSDEGAESYEGEYYSVEELMEAINGYVEKKNEKKTSTFERKGKIGIDQEAIDKAIHEASSLYVEKQQTKGNGSFYGVSRSDENSDEVKKSGGLITPEGVDVKEDQYISEDGAKAMMDGLIELPTEEEIVDAVKKIPEQEEKTTTITRKKMSPETIAKLKEYARRVAAITGVVLILLTHGPGPDPENIYEGDSLSNDSQYKTEQSYETPEDDIATMFDEEEIGNKDLEIGDVVELNDGVQFDHNSQGDDGLTGVIGEGEREAGDYTVDVISIMDADGNLIDYTSDRDGSLERLLEENGYTMEDIRNGKVSARYNVSEGINEDLSRDEAAGWINYDQDNYHDKGNVVQDNIEELNGGKSI